MCSLFKFSGTCVVVTELCCHLSIYYKKQLKRIQNGDTSVDRPEENDD